MDFVKAARWRHKGLISFEAEQRIVEAEGGDYRDAERLRRREALAYLGGLMVVGGGLALAFDVITPDLFSAGGGDSFGGLLITIALAVGLAGAAWGLDQGDPVSDRVVGFLAVMSVVAVGGFAGIVFFDVINPAEGSLLMFSVVTGAAAYGAWRWRQTALTQTAMHITAWLAVIGVLIVVGLDNAGFFGLSGLGVLAGLMFLGLGIAWLAFTYSGYLQPKTTGYVLGILTASAGSQMLVTVETGWVVVGLALGAGVAAFGIREAKTVVIFFGCYIFAGAAGVALSSLIDGSRGVAVAATIAGIAALLGAFVMRQEGAWDPRAPLAEATTDGSPPASPF